jgi:hypothetical protein
MTVTNQNLINEEIKSKLDSDSACCHSVQNMLSSHLLSKNVNIKIYKPFCMHFQMFEGIWSLIVRKEWTEGV